MRAGPAGTELCAYEEGRAPIADYLSGSATSATSWFFKLLEASSSATPTATCCGMAPGAAVRRAALQAPLALDDGREVSGEGIKELLSLVAPRRLVAFAEDLGPNPKWLKLCGQSPRH